MAGITVSATGVKSGPLTKPATIDLVGEVFDGTISGNFGGTIPSGEVWQITGNVNLTADLVVEGTLLGVDTFTLEGNGFQILVQNGGRLNLAGVAKSGWVRWGETVTGWNNGDRLAVAPTATGVYALQALQSWPGSWGSFSRPSNSPDVTLLDSSVAKPEVANLDRSIVLQNLSRIHFHEGAGVQQLRYLSVVDSGEAGVLQQYPIHFHLQYDDSRGSVVQGVVVEGGKNHAFVPHGSHGITFTDCIAYDTIGVAYWWDLPPGGGNRVNDSEDMAWVHCLSLGNSPSSAFGETGRLAGFFLGAGVNLTCVDSVAACVVGNPAYQPGQRSGFNWPENGARTSWLFEFCVAHNNAQNGIFVWQNAQLFQNLVDDFIAYHNGTNGVNHGAYSNQYQYRRAVLQGSGFTLHAKTSPQTLDGNELTIEDYVSDGPLHVVKHQSTFTGKPTFVRRCTFSEVIYTETQHPSWHKYQDCGLVRSDFDLAGINAASIIEIYEGGVLLDRWSSGSWE